LQGADLARVVTLMANTGQRGSDVVKMRWTDMTVHEGRLGINVTQKKTGLQIWVPLTLELARVIETWERRPGYLVLQRNGKPFSRERLSVYWDDERAQNPALAPLNEAACTLHGLRATAVVRLRRAGANAQQIADMVGISVPMVERYCRFATQKDNALAAVHYLDRTGTEQARLKFHESGP
jgi:integrase